MWNALPAHLWARGGGTASCVKI